MKPSDDSDVLPSGRHASRRRDLLKFVPLLFLAGCDYSAGPGVTSFLRRVQRFNDWVQSRVFDPNKEAPEYSTAELTPENAFRVNNYDTDQPDIDMESWSLTVDGLVSRPGEYALSQIQSLPKRTMNTRHCCVEGWSMIPQWGGATLRNFLGLAGADLSARYLKVECADDYYTSFDMQSVLHSQSLLCYEAYGKPLSLEHGAPARIVMPTKLGYKSAKWLTRMTVTNEKPGGYWEDEGYDWFAGI
ncbi:MAG TPA: molybdopterin-dependent oxidoreductase [Bacteroidota bacterium]|nr:molybdopterin-dependent oxidoreductase [Bacteroidota bacterium]